MAGSEDPMKNLGVVGSGSTAAERVEVVEEFKVEVPAAKRKADDSQVAAAGASSDEKAEAIGSGDVKAPEIKWVEMPLEYIAWLLEQKREEGLIPEIMGTDEAAKEEFFAFQEWVRETFDRNGCIMVPEDFSGPKLQDLIDEEWEKRRRELEMIDGCPPFNREEDTAVALSPLVALHPAEIDENV